MFWSRPFSLRASEALSNEQGRKLAFWSYSSWNFLGPELGLLVHTFFLESNLEFGVLFVEGGWAVVLFELLESNLRASQSQIVFSCLLCLLEPNLESCFGLLV